jgi:PPP family 3-phenylpropionic acid transporter
MLFAHSVLYTFYSLWLKAYGYSKIEIGVFWAIGVFAEIIFFLNQNRIFSIITNLTFVWFLCFLVAVGRFLLIYISEGAVALLVFAQLLHAVTFGLHHTCSILLIGELFPSSAKAIGQSSYTAAAYGIGGSLGGVFSGLVWERFNADSIFLLAVFAALAGCFVSWRLYRNFNMEFKEL